MSEIGMVELYKKLLLKEQSIGKLHFCEHCNFYKEKHVRFTKDIHNTKGILDCVHFDIWGSTRVPSVCGARYILIFIDNFSRKVYVFFLKKKTEVFPTFN